MNQNGRETLAAALRTIYNWKLAGCKYFSKDDLAYELQVSAATAVRAINTLRRDPMIGTMFPFIATPVEDTDGNVYKSGAYVIEPGVSDVQQWEMWQVVRTQQTGRTIQAVDNKASLQLEGFASGVTAVPMADPMAAIEAAPDAA